MEYELTNNFLLNYTNISFIFSFGSEQSFQDLIAAQFGDSFDLKRLPNWNWQKLWCIQTKALSKFFNWLKFCEIQGEINIVQSNQARCLKTLSRSAASWSNICKTKNQGHCLANLLFLNLSEPCLEKLETITNYTCLKQIKM